MRTAWRKTLVMMSLASLVFSIWCNGNTFEKTRAELKKKYGVEPKRWQGWIDSDSERPVALPFEEFGKQKKIAPTYLYTLAAGEGLILWLQKHPKLIGKIDGYNFLGADQFCSDVARLKAGGFLRSGYREGANYTCLTTENEQGKTVKYGVFESYRDAIEAFSALVVHRRSLFLKHAKEFGYEKPTEDQTAFWTYAYFVDGEGDAKKHLRETGLDFFKSKRTKVRDLAILRVSSWRYVQAYSKIED